MERSSRIKIRLLTAVSALCLTGGALSMAAGPASAATTSHPVSVSKQAMLSSLSHLPAPGAHPDASFQIINYNSGLCLGISGDRNDSDAVQWGCNGNADQQWHWGSVNATFSGWYQLVNGNGSCLGISAGSQSSGARVVGWSCLGSTHYDQYWSPINASCSGYVPLENLHSGYVLGVTSNSTAVGAAVVQFGYQATCNNQFWYGI